MKIKRRIQIVVQRVYPSLNTTWFRRRYLELSAQHTRRARVPNCVLCKRIIKACPANTVGVAGREQPPEPENHQDFLGKRLIGEICEGGLYEYRAVTQLAKLLVTRQAN